VFTVIRQRRTFLVAMAAAAVLCCGCDNGVGWGFYEHKVANIERDDITRYKTVKIGDQTWTAENLKIQTGRSWCYENNSSNCDKYGRLYDWNTAMNICPTGWHLPTRQDWNILVDYAGGSSSAGKKLKAASGWNSSGNGTDSLGFSALPGGYRSADGYFGSASGYGCWWTATEYTSGNAYYRYMDFNYDYVDEDGNDEGYGSVRCVKD